MGNGEKVLVSIVWLLSVVGASAAPAVGKQTWSDRLEPGSKSFTYMDKQELEIARNAEAMVRTAPTFAGGYVVGVIVKDKKWSLAGRGKTASGPIARSIPKENCSRPIDENLGQKLVILWGKALEKTELNQSLGFDGVYYEFFLKTQSRTGTTWSPNATHQPRMYGLAEIADDMFDACLTGFGVESMGSRISKLQAIM